MIFMTDQEEKVLDENQIDVSPAINNMKSIIGDLTWQNSMNNTKIKHLSEINENMKVIIEEKDKIIEQYEKDLKSKNKEQKK